MSNYEEDVWSNEIQEDDDEATIKLKQRYYKAEAELERINEDKEKYQNKNKKKNKHFAFKGNSEPYVKEKKHSSLIIDPEASGLARFGYDEQAHIDMKNGKGQFENLVENPKTRMAFYIGISILCVALIVANFIF